jgi:hypothetical protein
MDELRAAVICLAGLCSGAVVGAAIPTNSERKVRGGDTGWWPFSNGSLLGIILNQLLWLVFIAGLVAVVAIGILRVGEVYPLGQADRYLFAASLIVGAAAAKFARYRYWKSRDQWR